MPRTWKRGPEPIPADRLPDHFWSKVDKNGPMPPDDPSLGRCWIWAETRKKNGYGVFYVRRKIVHAHRYAYQIAYGPIMEGLQVLHNCHNGKAGCVRPSHLRTGTARDNARDALKRGTFHKDQCKRGHVLQDVGYYLYDLKRYCKACAFIRKPFQVCAGLSKSGAPCQRKIPGGQTYCYHHTPNRETA